MKRCFAILLLLCGAWPVTALAEAPQPVQQNNSNTVWFENWIGLSNATMYVSAPDGEVITVFAETGTPVFQLTGRDALDGIYRYEMTAATEEQIKVVNQIDNGRGDAARDTVSKAYSISGMFTVSRGVIVAPETVKEE